MVKRIVHTDVSKEVRALLKQTGEKDPAEAVRTVSRELLSQFLTTFHSEQPPINVEALASFRSIGFAKEPPAYSDDAELVPDKKRGVVIRVNRDRPITRQRFSIGHEVGHTLFAGYDIKVQCRKTRKRDWHDPSDVLEYLCDVASSEFIFPLEWFQADLDDQDITAERLLALAIRYKASPEATVRRFIDICTQPTAAVFFRWKHKPADGAIRSSPARKVTRGGVRRQPLRKLRVDYSVCNAAFRALGIHIPAYKSVAESSVIHQSAVRGVCLDTNREYLDLGSFNGWFRIHILPAYTKEADIGPSGESGVIAVLQPVRKPRAK